MKPSAIVLLLCITSPVLADVTREQAIANSDDASLTGTAVDTPAWPAAQRGKPNTVTGSLRRDRSGLLLTRPID